MFGKSFVKVAARVQGRAAARTLQTKALKPKAKTFNWRLITGAGMAASAMVGGVAFSQSKEMQNPSWGQVLSSLMQARTSTEDAWSRELLSKIEAVKISNPTNLAVKHFDRAYYDSLSPELKKRLLMVVKSGAENPDSGMGAYAMFPDDYDVFKPYLDKVRVILHHLLCMGLFFL